MYDDCSIDFSDATEKEGSHFRTLLLAEFSVTPVFLPFIPFKIPKINIMLRNVAIARYRLNRVPSLVFSSEIFGYLVRRRPYFSLLLDQPEGWHWLHNIPPYSFFVFRLFFCVLFPINVAVTAPLFRLKPG